MLVLFIADYECSQRYQKSIVIIIIRIIIIIFSFL